MADFSKPVTTDAYANVLTYLKATTSDLALGLDPATTTPTNVPTNSVRWNSASNKWQKYNGSTWADLAASYAINISGTAAGLSATLAIASGGTGATTAAAALVNMGERTGENGSTKLPTGTTAQRDGTPAAGYIRFNSDITKFEGYTGSAWASIADDAAVVTLTGNQTIAGTKTFSSSPVVPGLNGGQLAGMRNKIINGDMNIAQRGTSFAGIASAAYSVDRFQFSNSTAAVLTATQQADAPSNNEFQNSLRFAVTTADASIAATDQCFVQQQIEGYNVRDLIGKTFTLSFWVRSSKTGIHCVSFGNSGNDRGYVAEYTVSAANTWEQKSIPVSGGLITAGTWNWTNGTGVTVRWALAAGSNYQTTAGSWNTGSNLFATANQVNCLDTIGNIFAITGVQLEVGSVATPFEHRPYGAELALCQRYGRRIAYGAGSSAEVVATGYAYPGGSVVALPLDTPMRSTPSISYSALAHFIVENGVSSYTPTSISIVSGSTARLASIDAPGGSLSSGTSTRLRAQSASAFMFLSSEL